MARRRRTRRWPELKAAGTVQPREKEYFRKDGSRVPVLVGAATFEGHQDEGVAFVLDVTERKRAELERRQLASLVEQATEVMAISDLEGGTPFYLNKAGLKMFGFDSLEEARTRRGSRLHPPRGPSVLDNRHLADGAGARFLVGRDTPAPFQDRRSDSGPLFGFSDRRSENRATRKRRATVIDMTDRKQAEEKLRESEQRFRDYAETASDWLWETGPDHRVTRISEHVDAVGISPSRHDRPALAGILQRM